MRSHFAVDLLVLRPRPRALRVAAGLLVGLLIAAISMEFLVGAYDKYAHLDSPAYAMFVERHGWLWLHLTGGAIGVCVGPLQFLTQGRTRWRTLHRFTGRTYVVGMLIAIAGAVGLIATSPAPVEIRAAFAGTALAWLVCTFIGYRAIVRHDLETHRRWMVRSYLVTLAPITFRIALRTAVAYGSAPTPAMIAALLWLSWMLPIGVDVGARGVGRLWRRRSTQPAQLLVS